MMDRLLDTRFLKVYNNDGWLYASRKENTVIQGNKRPDAVIVWGRHIQTNRVPVIRQFRKSINDYIWELPAGLIEPYESIDDAAARELKEETGLYITRINGILSGFPSIGMSDEIQVIVKCEVNGNISLNPGLEDEDITVDLWDRATAECHIGYGEYIDGRLSMIFLGGLL